MALDLLQEGKPPIHLYRHDLESFFWVLAYFVMTYNPTQHTIGCIKEWTSHDLISVGDAKASFLSSRTVRNRVKSQMDPQYKPIWLTTLWPLVRKLNDLHIDYQKEQSQKLHYAYASMKGRKKDVERIGNELKVIVERRKNQIELSDFLDTLY